jgi:hypothetical protein
MTDNTNTLVDVYAWLEHAREGITELWGAIEPAMSQEMREHYEIAIGEITKAQMAIENALGSYETVQALLNMREEVGDE